MMSEEPEWRTYHDTDHDRSRVGLADTPHISDKNVLDVVEHIHALLKIPEKICEEGGIIFESLPFTVKGNNRLASICACVYLCQRNMQAGARTLQEFADIMGVEKSVLHKFTTVIKEHLYQNQQTKHMTEFKEDVNDTLYRLLLKVTDVPTNKIQEVKQIVLKLHNRIQSTNGNILQNLQIEKVNVALIYMACNFANIKTTMTHVATSCNTSLATICKIETLVKSALSRK